jgi:hypothetical protein
MPALHPPAAPMRGDTWKIAGTLFNADGTAFNLTGASLEWKLVDANGNTVLDFSLGSGIAVVNAAAGTCLITVTSTQSRAIAVGDYTDQLRATAVSGDIDTMWTGTIEVRPSLFV